MSVLALATSASRALRNRPREPIDGDLECGG
jgi:hypothetical protein